MSRFIHRELAVLGMLIALAVVMFLATRTLAAAHREFRRHDAAQWFRFGQSALAAGSPLKAVESLRRATAIDVDNQAYRLTLALALEGAGQKESARQVLLELRVRAPESPEINLRLARLDADRGDDAAAIRYYQNALYGLWPLDAMDSRRTLRLEFISYLLGRNHSDRALAELLAVENNLGDDVASHTHAGDLFLQAGDSRRALGHYEAALRHDRQHGAALAGAGTAAFRLGDYRRVLRYLRTAPEADKELSDFRAIASLVVTRDPLMPRLSYAERQQRLQMNLDDARARLRACSTDVHSPATATRFQEEIQALADRLLRERNRQSLDAIEDGVELVRRVEQQARERCGPPALVDRALLLIGQRHRFDPQ